MKKWIFLLLLFPFGIVFLKAQPSTSDTLAWRAIGQHVDFSNAVIYTGWQYHKSVTRLNEDFFWLIRSWRENNYEKKELFYLHQDYMTDPIDGFVDLADYLEHLESLAVDLPPIAADRLLAYGELGLQTVKEIDQSHLELEALIDALDPNNTETQSKVMDALKEQARLFDRLSGHLERFKSAIDRAYAEVKVEPIQDQNYQIAESFLEIVEPARSVLESVNAGDSTKTVLALNDLLVARELFFVEVEDELGKVQFYEPGKPIKPRVRYDFVLRQLDELIEYTEAFLEAEPLSRLPYSPAYFYYNERLISQFNRVGLGMAYQANLFLETTDQFLPKWQDATNWFDPIDEDVYDMPIELFDEPIETDPIVQIDSLPSNSLEGYASNNLVLLLDVSASMDTPEKLGLLKSSFRYLVDLMRPQDRVAIVTYSGDSKLVLASTSANLKNKPQILAAIDSLETEGRTSIINGLNRAYTVASNHYISSGNNKIILATDGVFDEEKKLWKLARTISRSDIQMSVLFYSRVEKEEAKSRLLELARNGNGNYVYVEAETADEVMLREAQKIQ